MLKKRIAAVLLIKDGVVVQSRGFGRYMPIGKPTIAVEFLDDWGIDEIILLDISATRNYHAPDYSMIRKVSTRCQVPLTIGGGISNIDQILELMRSGADKVSFNQAGLHRPKLITEAAKLFGDQCIVASIDSLKVDGKHLVYDYLQREPLRQTAVDFARYLQDLGAGEILINSVDRDGARCGFDLDLVNSVCDAVTVPVICCGGAGNPQHFIEVLESTYTSAAAAANFFHFTEHSVTTTKAIINRSVPVRHETHASYEFSNFDSSGRLLKRDERELEELLYIQIEKEII
jgi:cyclase